MASVSVLCCWLWWLVRFRRLFARRLGSVGTFDLVEGSVRTPTTCTGGDIPTTVTHAQEVLKPSQALSLNVPATATGTITLSGVILCETAAMEQVGSGGRRSSSRHSSRRRCTRRSFTQVRDDDGDGVGARR